MLTPKVPRLASIADEFGRFGDATLDTCPLDSRSSVRSAFGSSSSVVAIAVRFVYQSWRVIGRVCAQVLSVLSNEVNSSHQQMVLFLDAETNNSNVGPPGFSQRVSADSSGAQELLPQ